MRDTFLRNCIVLREFCFSKFESFVSFFSGEPGLVSAVAAAADGRGSLQAHVGGAEPAAAVADGQRPADLPVGVLPPLPSAHHGQRLPRQLAAHAPQGGTDHAQRHAGNLY